MNEYQAINLIKNTFENPFDKEQFINFTMNLLNLKSDEIIHKRPSTGIYTTKAFMDYIKSFYRIAKYEDENGKKIDILIVKLKKEKSLERARSMQRNFIAWYLKGSRGGILKDAALVAFVSPDNDDWRFSFVKIQYLFKDNKAAEMLSSALRYSFLVGKNEISYTAQTQLCSFLLDDISKPSLEMLEQAFSVEKVSKKFFKEYNFLYKKALDEFNSNEVFNKVLEQNSNLSVDLFVRKLLGQIVFMYFLQKKGWLGIKIDKPEWKDGNRKFLRWTFDDCMKKNKNYFDRFLQPLFYAGFNKKEELFQYDEFQFKIPFLNGGLFEELFHWESAFINPANNLFSNNEIQKDGSIGTGILDIFDRYNFTIDENTAFEKEIAVDPEMLGKVFENLLPENLRKGKGAYYTPREIVAYMTKESLVNYLTSKITPVDSEEKSKIEEKVRRLFDYKVLYINKKNKDKYGKEFEQQFYEMLDIVEDVNKHLKAIKIVDPACGSGAFPMGILLEIVSLREYIENEFLDNKISNYKLKKDTIQNSIYGVDIDPGAVVIAKLRFWLSLVVDAEKPEPLPNLDYKIMQGNSLIESFEGIDLSRVMSDNYIEMNLVDSQMDIFKDNTKQQKMIFSDKRKENIINLKEKYYPETDPTKKKEIQQKIDKIVLEHIHYNLETEKDQLQLTVVELKNNLKSRIKRLHNFSQLKELLKTDKRAKQIRKIKKDIFEIDKKFKKLKELEKSIERPYFLWHLFFSEIFEKENGVPVRHNGSRGGFDIVIGNPPWGQKSVKFNYYEKQYFKKKYHESCIGILDIFRLFIQKSINICKSKGIFVNILPDIVLLKNYDSTRKFMLDNLHIKVIDHWGMPFENVNLDSCTILGLKDKILHDHIIITTIHDKDKKIKNEVHQSTFQNLQGFKFNLYINQQSLKILEKLTNYNNFSDFFEPHEGIHSGNIRNKLFINHKINNKCRKLILGRDEISKYYISWNGLWVNYDKTIIDRENGEYAGLGKPVYFECDKIVVRRTGDYILAALDSIGYYFSNNLFICVPQKQNELDLRYVLAILNSKLSTWFYQTIQPRKGRLFAELKINVLKQIPIPKISKANQQPFIKLVDQIISLKKADKDTKDLENQIDLMVYKLYELTYEEVKIVNPEFDKIMSRERYERLKDNL